MAAMKPSREMPAQSLTDAPVFRIRLGAPRSGTPRPKLKSFIGRIKALVREQGGTARSRRAGFGRGAHSAARVPVRASPQRVAIKTRVINHGRYRRAGGSKTAIQDEIEYLRRRGASEDGEQGIAFDSQGALTGEELKAFRDRMVPDRHHFRIMVSPEMAAQLELPDYARELVGQMQKDLGSRLQWFGVAHYDTDNPHLHLIVRGKDAAGRDLVMSRDYISHGMRLQAGEIATRRLGPRLPQDIARSLKRDLTADRVTTLDRAIDAGRVGHPQGLVSALRGASGETLHEAGRLRMLARLQHLESLGLAREMKAGIWQPDAQLLPRLKALSLRGDIVKTLHACMSGKTLAMDPLILDRDHPPQGVFMGRVTARGRVDEFWDDEYLLIDTHRDRSVYLSLADAQVQGPAALGDVVRLQGNGQGRAVVTILGADLTSWVTRQGGTPLDQELARMREGSMRRAPVAGFAGEYGRSLQERIRFLKAHGLVDVEAGRWRVRQGFLDELYALELKVSHERLKPRYGEAKDLAPGAVWRGTVKAIEALPSGPHALIAHHGQYALVPATAVLERALNRTVSLRVGPPSGNMLEPLRRQLAFETTLIRARGIGRP